MSYNLGTASGRIEIDGRAGAAGFKVVETAANTFFDVVQRKVDSIEQMGRRMQIAGSAGVAGFGVAVKAASSFETQMSGVRAVAGGTEAEFEALRQKALQLGADTSYSASEAALAIEELAKAGIPIADILNGAAEGAVALAAAGGVSLPEAATIASNAMNQFGLDATEVTNVADILAGVANTSAADVSSLGQSLSQSGAVANLAGLSFKDTAIALGQMADAGIQGSDAGTSLKTMLNNLVPATETQSSKFKELGLLQYDLAEANKTLAKEGLKQADSVDQAKASLGKYLETLGRGTVGTVKNAKAVDELLLKQGGLNNMFFDSQGKVKSLGKLQGVLANSLKGMTREQKLANLEVLFGADAMRASAILSEQGAKGYKEFAEAVGQTTAAEVAKTRLDNLSGAVEAFKGSMETAFITIGSIFLPAITKVVQGATWLVNAFNNLPGPIKTAIAVIVGVVSIMMVLVGTILASLTTIAAFIAQWYAMKIILIATGYLKAFFAAMRAGTGIMAAHSAGMAVASTRTARLARITAMASKVLLLFGRTAAAAWALATGPVGLVVAAIAALVAIGVVLYKKWEPFRNLVDSIAAALKGYFLAAWEALQPVLKRAGEFLKQVGQTIANDVMPFLREAGRIIMGALGQAFKEIVAVVQAELLPALQGLADTFKSDVLPALRQAWTAIQPVAKVIGTVLVVALYAAFQGLKAFAKFMIGTVYPILIKVFGFFLSVAAPALAEFISGFAKVITGIIRIVSGLINIVSGLLSGDWSKVWDGMKQVVQGAWDIIKGQFQMAFSVIITLVKKFGTGVLNFFKGMFTGVDGATGGWISRIIGFFTTLVTTIFNVVKTGLTLLFNIWKTIFNLFWPPVKAVFNIIFQIIRLAWTIIKGVFLLALGFIIGYVRTQFNIMKTIISTAFNVIKNVVRAAVNFVRTVITTVWNAIKAVTSAVWNGIKAVVSSVAGALSGVVRGPVNAVKGVVEGAWNAIKNATTRAWNAVKNAIDGKINEVLALVGGLAGRVLGALGDFGSLLFNKGAELIQGLINGITSKLGAIGDAIGRVTDKIGGFLPGSPVKEGALTKWNRGRAGKMLMDFLASGLNDTSAIDKAMHSVATYVNGVQLMAKPAVLAGVTVDPERQARENRPALSLAASRPRKPAKGKGGRKQSRIVSGEVTFGPDGRMYIEGIAQDVYEENEEFKDNKPNNPGGGRRG